ncbi:MAG: hypothetical protein HY318_10385 [Armatimonadetes bacterium]|nr:hypothetical protein [Armatimonadota bacterium]
MNEDIIMGIIIVVIFFSTLIVLGVALAFLSVIIAHLVGHRVPGASDACSRYIAGWKRRQNREKRLFWTPLCMTCVLIALIAIMRVSETNRIRSNIIQSTRLIVRSGDAHYYPVGDHILLDTEDANAIKRFAGLISLSFEQVSRGWDCGGTDVKFELYRGQDLHYSFFFTEHRRTIEIIKVSAITLDDRKDMIKELSSRSVQNLQDWLDQTGVHKARDDIIEKGLKQRESIRESAHPEDAPDSE